MAVEPFHLTLLVENSTGYKNLCRILTKGHEHTRDGPQREAGQPSVALEQVERLSEGLVCLSGCAGDGALAGRWERGETGEAEGLGRRLLAAFGPQRFRVELQRALLASRPDPQPLAGLARAALGFPASQPGTSTATIAAAPASGRLRGGAPRGHPGGIRAIAAETRHPSCALPARWRAFPRPSRR
jgi:hypothetical protein